MTAESEGGTYHCPNCRNGYDGYHRCPEGTDRVQFVCCDCDELKNRESHHMDIEGIAPSRCAICSLNRMAEP